MPDFLCTVLYSYGNDIVVLIDGTYWLYENKANTNGEVIEFHGSQFSKADLSAETLEWLEWYNSLSPEEQLAVSSVPSELYASNGGEANADDYIVFHGKTFLKANLSNETLEWLEWYNSLSAEEQLCVSSIPSDLYTCDGSGTVEAGAVEYNCIGAFDVPDRRKIPEADIIMETRKGVALSYAPEQVAV